MAVITALFAGGMLAWMSLLALLIAVRALRGDIRVEGFLQATGAERTVAPERMVAMVIFPTVLLMYAMTALTADPVAASGRPTLPDVPELLLTLLAGGNSVYLAGKIARKPHGDAP